MAGLLRGVKVIESAQLFTGDYAGQILADEGAEVLKVESPFRGDYLRDFLGQIKPHTKGHSPLHMILNRNKQSVAVNLRTPEGKEIFWRMLQDVDVFLDGNTTGAMDKLGLGYEDQRKAKPDIIYAQVTGLGASGPYAKAPTHGQSMSGLAGSDAYELDDDGFPALSADKSNTIAAVNPVVTGPLYLAFGIAAALYRRSATGQGTFIDVACSDAALAAGWMSVVTTFNADRIGADETGMARASTGGSNSKYNIYQTKDGKYALAALIEHHFYENFCKGLGREDLLEESVGYLSKAVAIDWGPPELRYELRKIFRTKTLEEWMAFAVDHDTVIAPMNSAQDVRTDPHLTHREAVIEYKHPTAGPVTVTGNPIKVPGEHYTVYRHAPALGEHTAEYLRSLGYDEGQLKAWKEQGVI